MEALKIYPSVPTSFQFGISTTHLGRGGVDPRLGGGGGLALMMMPSVPHHRQRVLVRMLVTVRTFTSIFVIQY